MGDEVWSYDEVSGEFGWKTVTQTHENRYDGIIVTLVIGNEEIECTSGHPFFVIAGKDLDTRPTPHELGYRSAKEGRWVAAYYLQSGDQLLDSNGNTVTLSEVRLRNERTWIYNLTVAETHTYTIGSEQVVTHNQCPDGGAEHTKNARKSTQQKHEVGQARKQADQDRAQEYKAGQKKGKKKKRKGEIGAGQGQHVDKYADKAPGASGSSSTGGTSGGGS